MFPLGVLLLEPFADAAMQLSPHSVRHSLQGNTDAKEAMKNRKVNAIIAA